ncbi:rhomboid family intramembrane serine protease [Pseudomonas lalucatii]|uniref:Rhomboid family intramembrane serine protease n=1 Tax=Pseudomonas lalucatii TaxID=1424203 RepID=A0ABS5PZS2_9PSED|nr:rhomboid family intramembrane serine protease [Pseudomonas lalucatii]MBS7662018.1 rhomboid family intramembrane serine protease [Pseudomonas lalucatii]MBS7726153.1 rhomboid family intramembrane serine protease [Pseudomonas lalucatii]QVM88270.1 rhomboid family intramembrane serine protease [Pseudomonas lalucatii]
MLILPAEHPLDWNRPPVVTLLLILLNVLIYFAYQGGDQAREAQAIQTYLDGGLLGRERTLFLDAFSARHALDAEQRRQVDAMRRSDLARLVLYDLQFESRLRHNPAYQGDPAWQAARAKAEAARDRISSLRFGFIPARFSVEGLFGAMFLHGDFGHLASNMLFLFIFGFALEIALGRWLYLGLYLLSGVASHLLWWIMDPVWVSGVGASGAISGLMGMYLGVYGLRRINFFYWLGPLFGYFRAPALWILPVWLGKELYGLLLADDNVNYYAHLGGLGAGFLAVWLPRLGGQLEVDQAYLHKEDPDAPFKRELENLDRAIGSFALDQAASRGRQLLERHPGRLELLERLYPLARSRQDKVLLGGVLRQLFALPLPTTNLPLLQRLAEDCAAPDQPLLQHPAVQLHLLRHLLQAEQHALALAAWRRLSRTAQPPAELPALTLRLGKLLGRQRDLSGLAELGQFLARRYPHADQTTQLGLLRRHLAR